MATPGSYLRHIVGGISPSALRVDPGHLPLVVVDEVYRLLLQVVHAGCLRERGHVVVDVALCNEEFGDEIM